MTIATDNVGNHRELFIIKSNATFSNEWETFYYVHKWLDDVKVEQVVLRINFWSEKPPKPLRNL